MENAAMSSLPDRQLRNIISSPQTYIGSSLPDRQLRKTKEIAIFGTIRSLPDRQLRKYFPNMII